MPKEKIGKKISKKEKKEKPTTDNEVTEIVCVVDRSGSMEAIKSDAIGGFNNFLSDQKKQPGEAKMTIILFDDKYETLCSGKPVADVAPFNETTFVPRGSTALNDAVGRTITDVNQRNPKKCIIMILTDGHENNSHEFTKQQIKQIIADCEKKGWAVIYLSADANAFDDGKSIGVGINNIMSFQSDQRGAHVSNMAASFAVSDYRQTGSISNMPQYSARAQSLYDSQHPLSVSSTAKKHPKTFH